MYEPYKIAATTSYKTTHKFDSYRTIYIESDELQETFNRIKAPAF